MKDSVKESLKRFSFIKKLGLEFHDYETLDAADYILIQKWHDLEENLIRVIKSLEFMQNENYSPMTNLTLAYLYDIRYNQVPKNLSSDVKYEKKTKTS